MRPFVKKFKPLLVLIVLAATIAAFVYFFVKHPEVRRQLAQLPPGLLVLLSVLYLLSAGVLGLIFMATLVLCRTRLGLREGLLVSMYSSIINFFGPLQSGPAFRAVYLKQKHGLKLKDYTLATLVYYAFYGSFSVVLLFSNWLRWWLVPLALLGAAVVYWALKSKHPQAIRIRTLNLRGLIFLAAATLAQVLLLCVIYYMELHSVSPQIQPWQALVYTGAANLALFVSITPGAIGFRESFLVFSHKLHHVGNTTIVSANIIDRGVYIVVLLLLLVLILATHAAPRLQRDSE